NASMFFRTEDTERLKKYSNSFFRFFGLSEEEKCRLLIEDCKWNATRSTLLRYIEAIDSFKPSVTHFVEAAIRVDISKATDDIIIKTLRTMKYEGSKDIFIDYISFSKDELCLDLGDIRRKKKHTTRDIGAYPYEKYVKMAKSFFNETLLAENGVLEKSFEKSFCFETWLFICAHFVCGWRASDICNNWPYLTNKEIKALGIDVDNLKSNIMNSNISDDVYYEIGSFIEKSIELAAVKAHKTAKASDLLAPIGKELKIFFGRMALISYYHKIKTNEGELKEYRASEYLNHVRLRELFGNGIYDQLGRTNLSSRRLNKSYLQSLEQRARQDGAGTMAAYMIAAMARNHSDIDTTAIYIYEHGLSGETAEVVLAMMLDRGVFGSIKYKEFLAAFPDAFDRLSAREQTKFLTECNVSAYELEIMASDMDSEESLKEAFAEGKKKKALSILYDMFEISQGYGKSKESGVYCKKRALREACENPLFESCIANGCPYLVFTEAGIKSLIEVIHSYQRTIKETGNPKYERILNDVIWPTYREIMVEMAKKMKPEETKALKALIGVYNERYSKNN
ncbi:MAG: hypothetical protein K6F69_08495, partial [Treponema sp.]|nr:hypothetical protein [Treponema sp.]